MQFLKPLLEQNQLQKVGSWKVTHESSYSAARLAFFFGLGILATFASQFPILIPDSSNGSSLITRG